MLDQQMWRSAHMAVSLNQPVHGAINQQHRDIYYEDVIPDDEAQLEHQAEFMIMINSIKDKSVRNMLIITGYLVCNLDFLRKEYIQVLRTYDKDIRKNLCELSKAVRHNADIDALRAQNITVKERKRKISISDIIVALKMNIVDIMNPKTGEITYTSESPTSTLNDIREYLKSRLSLV